MVIHAIRTFAFNTEMGTIKTKKNTNKFQRFPLQIASFAFGYIVSSATCSLYMFIRSFLSALRVAIEKKANETSIRRRIDGNVENAKNIAR